MFLAIFFIYDCMTVKASNQAKDLIESDRACLKEISVLKTNKKDKAAEELAKRKKKHW